MLLESRNAVIHGGAGSIGGAVARAFAREGAAVFLAGRTPATLEAVAEEIRSASEIRYRRSARGRFDGGLVLFPTITRRERLFGAP